MSDERRSTTRAEPPAQQDAGARPRQDAGELPPAALDAVAGGIVEGGCTGPFFPKAPNVE